MTEIKIETNTFSIEEEEEVETNPFSPEQEETVYVDAPVQCKQEIIQKVPGDDTQDLNNTKKRYKCSECEKTFSRVGHLKRHSIVHSGEKPHACNICPKKFGRLEHLTRHLKSHTGEKPFECHICHARFIRFERLRTHIQMHIDCDEFMRRYHESNGTNPADVSVVQGTVSLDAYKSSNNATKSGGIKTEQAMDAEEFEYSDDTSSEEIEREMLEPDVQIQCDDDDRNVETQCDDRNVFAFAEVDDYTSYSESDTDSPENNTATTECSQNYISIGTGTKNLETKNLETKNVETECDICMKKFPNVSKLTRHRIVHTEEKPHECELCFTKFKRLEHLMRHLDGHSGNKRFECDLCQKNFSRLDHLYRHKRLSCKQSIALRELYNKSLESAMNSASMAMADNAVTNAADSGSVDESKKSQVAVDGACDKTSPKKVSFMGDDSVNAVPGMTTHTCMVCMRTFGSSQALNGHKKSHNTIKKPIECEICFKTFTRLYHLNRHQKCHETKKPYSCEICLKDFTRLDHLRRHKRLSCKVVCDGEGGANHREDKMETSRVNHENDPSKESVLKAKTAVGFSTEARIYKQEIPLDFDSTSSDASSKFDGELVDGKLVNMSDLVTGFTSDEGESLKHKKNVSNSANDSSNGKVRKKGVYSCDICQKTFANSSTIYRHRRIHTGVKPFECNVCSKKFGRPEHLKRHLETHNTLKNTQPGFNITSV